MRPIRGVVNGALLEARKRKTWFVRWSWAVGLAAPLVLLVSTCGLADSYRNRRVTEVSPIELPRFVPARGAFVRINAEFVMADFAIGKDGDAERYYSVMTSPGGSVLVRSRLPIEQRVSALEGVFKTTDSDVMPILQQKFTNVPALELDVDSRPTDLWVAILQVFLSAALLLAVVRVSTGRFGVRGIGLPTQSGTMVQAAFEELVKTGYWRVNWIHEKWGAIESALAVDDSTMHLATTISHSMSIGEFEADDYRKTDIRTQIPFADINKMMLGSIPIWLRERPCIVVVAGKTVTTIFSERPEPLLGLLHVLGVYVASKSEPALAGEPAQPADPTATSSLDDAKPRIDAI